MLEPVVAFMVEGGAARIGCTVIPAGSGQTELQVQAMTTTSAGMTDNARYILSVRLNMGRTTAT